MGYREVISIGEFFRFFVCTTSPCQKTHTLTQEKTDRQTDGHILGVLHSIVIQIPTDTLRNNDVVITSKQRHFDVITSKWRRFDVIATLSLRQVSSGSWLTSSQRLVPEDSPGISHPMSPWCIMIMKRLSCWLGLFSKILVSGNTFLTMNVVQNNHTYGANYPKLIWNGDIPSQ